MANIEGTNGADLIEIPDDEYNLVAANAGDDIVVSGLGRDFVGGGDGFDTFITGIPYANGANLTFADDRYFIGGPDNDIAVGVERLIYTDTVVLIDPANGLQGAVALPFTELNPILDAFRAVLRTGSPDLFAEEAALSIRAGELTFGEYVGLLVDSAVNSTVPAILMQAAVLGTIPTSDKMDSLTTFARGQYDYYANTLKSAFASIGPYEALGRGFSSTAEFKNAFAGGADTTFIESAYSQIFDRQPTAAQKTAFGSQVDYFEALYVRAGLSTSQASLEARGAVYGQMVGYAAVDTSLPYSAIARSVLGELATGDTSSYGTLFGQ